MNITGHIRVTVPIRAAAVACCCLLLAACGGAKVYQSQFHPNYQHLELMAAHGGTDMRIEILGQSDPTREAMLAEAVGDAMSGRNPGLPIRFTPTPTDAVAGRTTRIAVLFGARPGLLGRALCTRDLGPHNTAEAAPEEIGPVLIAYCRRETDLSSLRLDLPPGAGPDSPAFADAFALATRLLLPLESPDQKGEGRPDDFEM